MGGFSSDPLPGLFSGGREVVQVLHEKETIVQENQRRSEKQEGGGNTTITRTQGDCGYGQSQLYHHHTLTVQSVFNENEY